VASGIGKQLSDARSDRGIELAEIEERIKIRSRYLRAMEEERWELLPGPAYARGFLRTYGDFLGLDGAALADEYLRLPEPEEEPGGRRVRQITPSGHPDLAPPRRTSHRFLPRRGAIAAGSAAAILAILLVLGLTLGSDDDSGNSRSEAETTTSPTETSPAAAETPAEPSSATLRLTATGTVWVCLVDEDGEPVIEGVTLTAGEKQGPFEALSFKMTFGNGQLEMEANGDPVPVEPAAEPLGYRVTPEKTKELAEGSRPTCT
jgi:cytoskeleton protein RodZ